MKKNYLGICSKDKHLFCKVVINEEEKEELVCGDLKIISGYADLETNEKEFVMSYYDSKFDKNIEFRCGIDSFKPKQISKTLSSIGALVKSEYEPILSDYIQNEMIAWDDYKNSSYFCGFNDDCSTFYTNKAISLTEHQEILQNERYSEYLGPYGDEDTYMKMLNECANICEMQLALALGASGTLATYVNQLADCNTLVIGIHGKSSTGKSTAMNLATSVFAKPKMDQMKGFIRTASSTQLALTEVLRDNNGITVSIDDMSATFKGNVEKLVYTMEAGQSKGHMNSDYKIGATSSWSGAILMNSETQILSANAKHGAFLRYIDFANVNWTKDAEHSRKIKDIVSHNYGFLGERFVEYIMRLGKDTCFTMVKEYQNRLINAIGDMGDEFTDRHTMKMAIVGVSAEILAKLLSDVIEFDLNGIFSLLVKSEKNSIKQRNIETYVRELLITELKTTISTNVTNKYVSTGYGAYKIIGKRVYYYVLPIKYSDFLDDNLISASSNSLLTKWQKSGFLMAGSESDRKTTKYQNKGHYKFVFEV